MTTQVRLLDEAVAELQDASNWYEDPRPGLGLVVLGAVGRTIDHLSRWPDTGTLIDGVAVPLGVIRTAYTMVFG